MDISRIYSIFNQAIMDYHVTDSIEQTFVAPIYIDPIDSLYYQKAWIDNVQWHCEDEVRNPTIDAEKVRYYKNKIDSLNQERTNLVEHIDDYILNIYKDIKPQTNARLNTESPAWAIDRLSILALKIYHMGIESNRTDLPEDKKKAYQTKYTLLQEQKNDLIQSIGELLSEINTGNTIFKVYRQVKMYNDNDLNPILRGIHGK